MLLSGKWENINYKQVFPKLSKAYKSKLKKKKQRRQTMNYTYTTKAVTWKYKP